MPFQRTYRQLDQVPISRIDDLLAGWRTVIALVPPQRTETPAGYAGRVAEVLVEARRLAHIARPVRP